MTTCRCPTEASPGPWSSSLRSLRNSATRFRIRTRQFAMALRQRYLGVGAKVFEPQFSDLCISGNLAYWMIIIHACRIPALFHVRALCQVRQEARLVRM